jgi:hypothetical protein
VSPPQPPATFVTAYYRRSTAAVELIDVLASLLLGDMLGEHGVSGGAGGRSVAAVVDALSSMCDRLQCLKNDIRRGVCDAATDMQVVVGATGDKLATVMTQLQADPAHHPDAHRRSHE